MWHFAILLLQTNPLRAEWESALLDSSCYVAAYVSWCVKQPAARFTILSADRVARKVCMSGCMDSTLPAAVMLGMLSVLRRRPTALHAAQIVPWLSELNRTAASQRINNYATAALH